MADLPITVDSSSAVSAAVDLDRLYQAAVRAGEGVDFLSDSSNVLRTRQGSLLQEIDNNVASLRRQLEAENALGVGAAAASSQLANQTVQMHNLRFASANVASQFQDIAVTAQMGMNPFTIALQQGTQLSMAMGINGGGLRGALDLVKEGLKNIFSPLSLVTIGSVFLVATLIEGFGKTIHYGESVTQMLKRQNDQIKDTVHGYKDAGAAVQEFIDKQSQQPRGVVQIQLGGELKAARLEAEKFHDSLDGIFQGIASSRSQSTASRQLADFINQFQQGKISVIEFAEDMAMMQVNPAVEGQVKDLAKWLQEGALAAASLQDLLITMDFAAASTGFSQGVKTSLDSMIEARRSAEAHQIEIDSISAKSPSQLADIARRRESLSLADKEMTTALREQKVREAASEALVSASYAISEADRERLRAANDNVDTARMQLEVIGKSISESTTLTFVQQQLASAYADAAKNGVSVSQAYIAQIEQIGAEYGRLQQQIKESGTISDLLFDSSQIGRSSVEQDVASTLRSIYGDDFAGEMDGFIARQIRINDNLQTMNDIGSSAVTGWISKFKSDLREGTSLWDAFWGASSRALDGIADKALEMAGKGIWNMIFNALSGSIGGPSLGIDTPNITSGGALFAKGGAFSSGTGLVNTVVDQPTMFRFAKGGALGQAGEAGAEGILPLRRNAQGQLGVMASGGRDGGGGVSISIGQVVVQGSTGNSQMDDAYINKVRAGLRDEMERIANGAISKNLRHGGMLNQVA